MGSRQLWRWWWWLPVLLLACWGALACWAKGDYSFAAIILFAAASAISIFSRRGHIGWRFLYPALLGSFIFMLLPLLLTVGYAFTNHSNGHQLPLKAAIHYLLDQTILTANERLTLRIEPVDGDQYRLWLQQADGGALATAPFALKHDSGGAVIGPRRLAVSPQPGPLPDGLGLREQAPLRPLLKALVLVRGDGQELRLLGMREFAPLIPAYRADLPPPVALAGISPLVYEQASGHWYAANFERGFFERLDPRGQFSGQQINPGFVTNVGLDNFRLIASKGESGELVPRLGLFTLVLAVVTVVLSFGIGLPLAALLLWPRLPFARLFRAITLLPMAVPMFVTVAVLASMFSVEHGVVNLLLGQLMREPPQWFVSPVATQLLLIGVSVWLATPYAVMVGMGLIQSVSPELFEAAVLDGAGPVRRFVHVTLPLVWPALIPLLLSSFAFHFNNFGLVLLLTGGNPMFEDSFTMAGHTDTLLSYAYFLAFGLGGREIALASAYNLLLFPLLIVLVGAQLWWVRRSRGGL
ncbi:MAG: ABC transporter permease subunit [Gammaproteobacteria bacterium]|nr:ABC transporter permease subunit [Gammaproteobacteria bacterium]